MKIVKEIKEAKNLSITSTFLSCYLISERFSPYLSSFFIKRNVIPNKITLYMILSGIIGAILFAIPNIYIKIIGAILIHLWFILDCSDGEVARYTKTFSKYGKELDFVAHIINHPLFGIALFCSLYQLDRYNVYVLAIVIIASNFMDYLVRNVTSLQVIIGLKEPSQNGETAPVKWGLKQKITFVTDIFTIYPNFILFGVIIYFVDYMFNTNILFYYTILNAVLTFGIMVLEVSRLLKRFYHS